MRSTWPKPMVVLCVLGTLIAACGSSSVPSTLDDPVPGAQSVSPAEYVDRLVRCIETGGGQVDRKNSVTFAARPGPDISGEAMEQLMSDCYAQAGPPPERRFDDETARDVYAQYIDVHRCLVDLGYTPDTPPSEEVFVDQFGSRETGWHPYDGLYERFGSVEEQAQVEEACPPWAIWR